MTKIVLSVGFAILFSFSSLAQTATNFVANDCTGNSHDLFATLDEGKVVVICWVMPCASCTGPALTAYNIVTYYQNEHPGQVLFYMVDDYANTPCSSLDSWANSKNIPANNYSFRFVNTSIKMSDYGTDGMPKTIVLGGGSAHQVYLNSNFTLDPDELKKAIDQAMLPSSIADPANIVKKPVVYPNPADDVVTMKFFSDKNEKLTLQVIDITGNVVQESIQYMVKGENEFRLYTRTFSNGIYFIRSEGGTTISKLLINR